MDHLALREIKLNRGNRYVRTALTPASGQERPHRSNGRSHSGRTGSHGSRTDYYDDPPTAGAASDVPTRALPGGTGGSGQRRERAGHFAAGAGFRKVE